MGQQEGRRQKSFLVHALMVVRWVMVCELCVGLKNTTYCGEDHDYEQCGHEIFFRSNFDSVNNVVVRVKHITGSRRKGYAQQYLHILFSARF
jgi:hypothetical protein